MSIHDDNEQTASHRPPPARTPESAPSRVDLWVRYRQFYCEAPEIGFSLDISRVRFGDHDLEAISDKVSLALSAMTALEGGARANIDEDRMVGHYWLRAPQLAPTPAIESEIRTGIQAVRRFVETVRRGDVTGADGGFEHVIHVGIGGSSLGPRLLCEALETTDPPIRVHFLDNADPDGIDRLLRHLDGGLGRTLVSIVSKSGWTPTPIHVMAEIRQAYCRAGLNFAQHAVATTMEGTDLDRLAVEQKWLARFPLWDWVGGRTSVTSNVGLLPAALQGIDIDAFLEGAATMDRVTRGGSLRANLAALLAAAWYFLGNGRGEKNMVVLPYKDQLVLFGRYVQQLVMESVGKRHDRAGNLVHQGFSVYGNKGSTDQHSYVQQLRDGPADFFATFIYCADSREHASVEVEQGLTLGDFLHGYLEGTRDALYERGRDSITIRLPALSAATLGALIALYERAVGIYGELINVNVYNQPGVDKAAAAEVVRLQAAALEYLLHARSPKTTEEIARGIEEPERIETIYKVLERLAGHSGGEVTVANPSAPRFSEQFKVCSGRRHDRV